VILNSVRKHKQLLVYFWCARWTPTRRRCSRAGLASAEPTPSALIPAQTRTRREPQSSSWFGNVCCFPHRLSVSSLFMSLLNKTCIYTLTHTSSICHLSAHCWLCPLNTRYMLYQTEWTYFNLLAYCLSCSLWLDPGNQAVPDIFIGNENTTGRSRGEGMGGIRGEVNGSG